MKSILTLAGLLAGLNLAQLTARAQGSLTPPAGAPAPVMKSLDQVEARTPLVAGQPGVTVAADGSITITNGGSYYLTKNLTITNGSTGIHVGTNTATIDLNGFIVSGAVGFGSGSGIVCSGTSNQSVVIRNGFIAGGGTTGFAYAIYDAPGPGAILVENVQCKDVRDGIVFGDPTGVIGSRRIVRNSSVQNSGHYGIIADTITGCSARNTTSYGIAGGNIDNCQAIQFSGAGAGIYSYRGRVSNSYGESVGGEGIHGIVVVNSHGVATPGSYGISGAVVTSSIGQNIGGTAISAFIATACYALAGTNNISNKYNMP